jgi:hypothetical protein
MQGYRVRVSEATDAAAVLAKERTEWGLLAHVEAARSEHTVNSSVEVPQPPQRTHAARFRRTRRRRRPDVQAPPNRPSAAIRAS